MRLGGSADSLVWELARKLTDLYNSMQPVFCLSATPPPMGHFFPFRILWDQGYLMETWQHQHPLGSYCSKSATLQMCSSESGTVECASLFQFLTLNITKIPLYHISKQMQMDAQDSKIPGISRKWIPLDSLHGISQIGY